VWVIAPVGGPAHDVVAALGELAARVLIAPASSTPPEVPAAVIVVASDDNADFHVKACDRLENDDRLAGIPIIVAASAERLRAADDVHAGHELIVRPVRPAELAARLARARRAIALPERDQTIRYGALDVDPVRREVTVHGRLLELTAREYELLAFLAAHPSRAFSRSALISTVWTEDYDGGSRTVDVHVRRLRAKLGPPMADWLRTIRSVGYMFEPQR
jgi:DNA-binding response OmpR family regulator